MFLGQVKSDCHVAIVALFDETAVGTFDERGEPPPVLQQDNPFVPFKPFHNGGV